MTEPDYVKRMDIEYIELCQKALNLMEFIRCESFADTDEEQQKLMNEQLDIMMSYLQVLRRRIALAREKVE
jgi:hypothetical protein